MELKVPGFQLLFSVLFQTGQKELFQNMILWRPMPDSENLLVDGLTFKALNLEECVGSPRCLFLLVLHLAQTNLRQNGVRDDPNERMR